MILKIVQATNHLLQWNVLIKCAFLLGIFKMNTGQLHLNARELVLPRADSSTYHVLDLEVICTREHKTELIVERDVQWDYQQMVVRTTTNTHGFLQSSSFFWSLQGTISVVYP